MPFLEDHTEDARVLAYVKDFGNDETQLSTSRDPIFDRKTERDHLKDDPYSQTTASQNLESSDNTIKVLGLPSSKLVR